MKFNMRLTFCLACCLSVFISSQVLAAVTEVVPAVVPAKAAIDVSGKQITRTADFLAWRVNVDPIDIVGTYHTGIFCSNPQERHYWTKFGEWAKGAVRDSFTKQQVSAGYPKHKSGESAFEEKVGSDADFKAGATLLDFKFNECGTGNDVKGTVYIKMKWELFSVLRQKVVYTKVVESSFDNTNGSALGSDDFYRKLFDANVLNLLSDPGYVATFENGGGAAGVTTEQPLIATKSSAPVKVDVMKSSSSLQAAVVTIESGTQSGSGFFVGDDGYVLTNEHVVGGAKYVKLKTSNGKSLIGQVMRIDSIRDVALIKTESNGQPSLAIRKTAPAVGEEVFAIGSPFGDKLSGTLTQGVLSSRRTLEGVTFLQSDVAVTFGNSGGPLLDASGAVIGMTVMGIGKTGGINFFIPIDEALEKLALNVN